MAHVSLKSSFQLVLRITDRNYAHAHGDSWVILAPFQTPWHLGPLLRVNPLGTQNRNMRESQRVKGLRSKLGPVKQGLPSWCRKSRGCAGNVASQALRFSG